MKNIILPVQIYKLPSEEKTRVIIQLDKNELYKQLGFDGNKQLKIMLTSNDFTGGINENSCTMFSVSLETETLSNESNEVVNNNYDVSSELMLNKKVKNSKKKSTKRKKCNNDIENYTSSNWASFIREKFESVYGKDSYRFYSGESSEGKNKMYGAGNNGKIISLLKTNIVERFKSVGLDNSDIRDYIKWAYEIKAPTMKYPLAMNLLINKDMMTDWLVSKDFKKSSKGKIKVDKSKIK